LLADLVTKLTRLGSAAIAFDIIFAESDRMSPAIAAQSFRPSAASETAEQR
jgi:adenylate cyclase